MTAATGVGSMPGTTDAAYAEAVRLVLGELPDLPHVPELPGRGVAAAMTGRALAIVDGLAADLQPAGWRLTDASGVDHRRARSLLAQDLDAVEELAQGYTGTFKTQVTGPWTLAATVEKPRGDKVLSDHGARRELAQSLAEGLRTHLADLRRRLSGVDRWIVQVDEPALAAVANAQVPTASGFGRHRRVDPPEASAHLEWVVEAITDAGAEAWVHSCAPGDAVGAGRRDGRGRSLGRPRPARPRPTSTPSPRRWRAGGRSRSASFRPPIRPPRPPTRRSPSGCSAGSTCWASTRRPRASTSSSPRPAGWPAPPRSGPRRPSPVGDVGRNL